MRGGRQAGRSGADHQAHAGGSARRGARKQSSGCRGSQARRSGHPWPAAFGPWLRQGARWAWDGPHRPSPGSRKHGRRPCRQKRARPAASCWEAGDHGGDGANGQGGAAAKMQAGDRQPPAAPRSRDRRKPERRETGVGPVGALVGVGFRRMGQKKKGYMLKQRRANVPRGVFDERSFAGPTTPVLIHRPSAVRRTGRSRRSSAPTPGRLPESGGEGIQALIPWASTV